MFKLLKRQVGSVRGFSVTGLMVGIAVLAIVLLGSGYVLIQSKQVEVRMGYQSDLDRAHLLGLQKTRSVKFLKRALNLNTDASQNASGTVNQDLINCFSKRGTNCNAGTNPNLPITFQTLTEAQESTACTGGASCQLQSQVRYRLICSNARSCRALEIEFATVLSGANTQQFRERKALVKMPGILFADQTRLTFACAQSANMTGINFEEMAAECPEQVTNACNNNAPIGQYTMASTNPSDPAQCPPLAAANCPNGVKDVGLYGGQPTCW